MKQILKGMAEAAKRTAKMSANSASFFGLYQPKEPDVEITKFLLSEAA